MEVMDLKFTHNVDIPFKIVVPNFQPFPSISLKIVAFYVNIDLRFSPEVEKASDLIISHIFFK